MQKTRDENVGRANDADKDGDEGDDIDITNLDDAKALIKRLKERAFIAEAQVASHWELLRRIFDLIIVFDMSGVIVFASPACEEILGYPQSEMFNRPLASILDDEYQAEFQDRIRSMMKIQTTRALTGRELFLNARFVKKDKTRCWLEGVGQAWQLDDNVELVFVFREMPPGREDFDAAAKRAAAANVADSRDTKKAELGDFHMQRGNATNTPHEQMSNDRSRSSDINSSAGPRNMPPGPWPYYPGAPETMHGMDYNVHPMMFRPDARSMMYMGMAPRPYPMPGQYWPPRPTHDYNASYSGGPPKEHTSQTDRSNHPTE